MHNTMDFSKAASEHHSADYIALDRLFSERHSCRAYLPDLVPRLILERIVTMAQRTASWCNSQAWQVLITSGAATDRFRKELLKTATANPPASDIAFPRAYENVYLDRRRKCGFQLYDSVGISKDDKAASSRQMLENFRLFGAPHVAIITAPEALGTYGAVDCGAYVANFLLAARSCGVASIAQAAIASQSAFVRHYFDIPKDRHIVCGISFGYPDKNSPVNAFRTERASISDSVTWIDA